MEFWGFNRAENSLRIEALQHITSIADEVDLERLASVVPVPESPLDPEEVELVVALATGASTVPPNETKTLWSKATKTFLGALNLTIDITADYNDAGKNALLKRLGSCPSRVVTNKLTPYLSEAVSGDFFLEFLDAFESKWKNVDTLSGDQVAAAYGALLGFVEALSNPDTNTKVLSVVYSRITPLSESEFLSNVQPRLAELTDAYDLSTQVLINAIAQYVARYAHVARTQDEVAQLATYSNTQLEQLESVVSFHADASSGYAPYIRNAMAAHLKVLSAALDRFMVEPSVVFPHVIRGLSHPENQSPVFGPSICRMASIVSRRDEYRLGQVLELLPRFLTSLEPRCAFQSAQAFAASFKMFHMTESSRVKLLYLLLNELSAEEYKSHQLHDGEQGALEYVASLLSALMAFVSQFESTELAGLAVTVLDQKFGGIDEGVDAQIVVEWALLVPHLTSDKIGEVLNLLVQVEESGSPKLIQAVKEARVRIAENPGEYKGYFEHLLDLIVLKSNKSNPAIVRGMFAPLATLTSSSPQVRDWSTLEKIRNAWFNLAILGFTVDSLKGEDLRNLRAIAKWAPPLVSEQSANHMESDLQINPVLARGAPRDVLSAQKNALAKILGSRAAQHSSTTLTLFISATLLLEGLRARAGSIAKLPHYLEDTEFSSGEGHDLMIQLTRHLTDGFVSHLGFDDSFNLISVARVLRELLVLCCHRVDLVRHVAVEMVTRVVNGIPAALGQHDALFALLDCLTLLGESTTNASEDEYSPKAVFVAPVSGIKLELSDRLDVRRRTLSEFETAAKLWVAKIATLLAPDLRSKLYTYLGISKAVGRGRKFALALLSADDANEDFISQYVLLTRYDAKPCTETFETAMQRLIDVKSVDDLELAYTTAAPHMRSHSFDAVALARESVRAPFRIFTGPAIAAGITFWHHTIRNLTNLRVVIVNEVIEQSILTAHRKMGLFGRDLDEQLPLWVEMEYAPSDKKVINRDETLALKHFDPHMRLLSGFLRSGMYNSVMMSPAYMASFARLTLAWLKGLRKTASLHSLARVLRLKVLSFASEYLRILWAHHNTNMLAKNLAVQIEAELYRAGLSWYTQPVPQWPYGSSVRTQETTLRLLKEQAANIAHASGDQAELLYQFVCSEYNALAVWHDPLSSSHLLFPVGPFTARHVQLAWQANPDLAVSISRWQVDAPGLNLLRELVETNTLSVYDRAEALQLYLDARNGKNLSHHVLYWAQVSPIESINLLLPSFGQNPYLIQFALRSLEMHPITICFFYVPQIVQLLRHDKTGLIEEYILEAAKFSQKFAHQIIWNINANMYVDDDGTIPNDMKPKLDHVLAKMKQEFTAPERQYYDTEFSFFDEVTSISGKLKPFIKRSKAEKKEKIDEEMAKIQLPDGVYLPSHPDGTVVDIDRHSGKPLQSHAKAPFLARFKIHVDKDEVDENDVSEIKHESLDVWQAAIFKVGDDCRQDVLALQMISVFRSIFNYCGLDVFVYPYKVTATAAGRGVIDVLPNSISRDMLGREAVNGLDQWFYSKHGGPDSIDFQRARLNFVKSMAAYSVITWLIQFKDRHNGNIMYDDDGHVIHIDFGFCFDIAPGGVRFEAAPFKLTKEMVQVMGGSQTAMPYKWFEELCVRAFLASRVFADDICRLVIPMLDSGLPCFKGHTIKRLRDRLALNKTEAEAAHYMRTLISKSYESNFTKGYDEFQRLTNGIPY